MGLLPSLLHLGLEARLSSGPTLPHRKCEVAAPSCPPPPLLSEQFAILTVHVRLGLLKGTWRPAELREDTRVGHVEVEPRAACRMPAGRARRSGRPPRP